MRQDSMGSTLGEQLDFLSGQLPPYWAWIIRSVPSRNVHVQRIYDFAAHRYSRGNALLCGDAASIARPHTGSGALKALQDACALESALKSHNHLDHALSDYSEQRSKVARQLVKNSPDWKSMTPDLMAAWWDKQNFPGIQVGGSRLPPFNA
jgi:2-polyprenyl-6-methoxyphenol hydroxylase-like FAD-dependent oxidoreductase